MKLKINSFKKIISCFLVFSLLFISASALPRNSEYLATCNASLSASTQGGIKVTVNVSSTRGRILTKIGVDHIVIQESVNNGRTWRTVVTSYPSMSTSGSSYAGSKVIYNGTAGNQYRASVTFIGKDASGNDTRVVTTNVVTARK